MTATKTKNNGLTKKTRTRTADALLGELLKKQGIENAANGVSAKWKHIALEAVRQVAACNATFTTDDVWNFIYNESGSLDSDGDNRAMGAIMTTAGREGWCKASNKTKKTNRASNHRRPLTVWYSNIFTADVTI